MLAATRQEIPRPLLIVDLSRRTLCALLVTPEGEVQPVSPEVGQVATRVLSTDILFDPRPSQDPDADLENALEILASSEPRDLFRRARRVGLRRPWDRGPHEQLLRLASPLAVLSSPAARLEPEQRPLLSAVAVALLRALMAPLFAAVAAAARSDQAAVESLVIVPADTGRAALLALRLAFRRGGLRRPDFLSRELAAGMALLESPGEYQVWDLTGEDLRLHCIEVTGDEMRRRLRTIGARTARGLGWPYWVRQIGKALGSRLHLPAPPSAAFLSSLDSALASLLGGVPGVLDLALEAPLRLSHAVLEDALDGGWSERVSADLRAQVAPALAALGAAALPRVCCLGAAANLRPVQDVCAALGGGARAPFAEESSGPERLARGVAAAVLWRRHDPARRIVTAAGGSLRLDSLNGEARELLPAERLPRPGETCALRHRFGLAGRGAARRSLLVHLLWGADPEPEGNASLCSLLLAPNPAAAARQKALFLAIHLARSSRGCHLRATVEARLEGDGSPAARGFFATHFSGLPPAVGGPLEEGE